MYGQAPMFFGSSWTHTTGVPSGRPRALEQIVLAQRIELLDAHDGDVVAPRSSRGRDEIVVDLARAEQHAPTCFASRRPAARRG